MMTVNDENVWNIQARLEFRSQGENRRETRLKKGQSEGKGRLWRKKEVGRERMMPDLMPLISVIAFPFVGECPSCHLHVQCFVLKELHPLLGAAVSRHCYNTYILSLGQRPPPSHQNPSRSCWQP